MEASNMAGKVRPGSQADQFLKAGNTASQLVGGMFISKATKTPINKLNTLNGNLPIPGNSVGSTGANKSASNRSRGMQNNVGMQEAQAGSVGSVNTNMVNAELQNDDLLGIYTKGI